MILSCLLLHVSCSTTKYYYTRGYSGFNDLKINKKYWVYGKDDQKTSMIITSVEKDSIKGYQRTPPKPSATPWRESDNQNNIKQLAFAKKYIAKIKKPQPAGTVAIVAGGAVGVGIITYYFVEGMKVIGSLYPSP